VGKGERAPRDGRTISLQRGLDTSAARHGYVGWAVACRRGRGRQPHDELTPGRGTRDSKAVTRCSSALTGQELGRWRRIRSLYCLIWVAIWKRVRMTVEGCACARAVCWRVG